VAICDAVDSSGIDAPVAAGCGSLIVSVRLLPRLISTVAGDTSAATEQASASAEQTSASTQQVSASSTELARSAEQLSDLVARFTISRAGAR